jgi:hypothetical protein
MYFEKSSTIEWPTACPASDVPPPRGKTETSSLLASSITALHITLMARYDDANRLDLID